MAKNTGIKDIDGTPINQGDLVQVLITHYDFDGMINSYEARTSDTHELIQFVVEDFVFGKCVFQDLIAALQTKAYSGMYVGKELRVISHA